PAPRPRVWADVREDSPVLGEPLELLGRDEPVLPSVHLSGSLISRRRRYRELELRHRLAQGLLERALAGTRRAGDDDDQRLSGGRGQSALTVDGRRGLPPSSTG